MEIKLYEVYGVTKKARAMEACSISINDKTDCKNKIGHDLILDDKLYRVCDNCYNSLLGSIKFSKDPLDVKVRVFTNREWTDKEISMLGKFKDKYVAEKLGISISSVSSKRRELEIPFLKVDRSRQRQWSDDEIEFLGEMPDRELAKQLNISTTTVGNKRRQLKIRSFDRPGRDWTEKELTLLGTMPDRMVADRLGIPYHKVYEKRRKMKIPAMSKRKFYSLNRKVGPLVKKHHDDVGEDIFKIYDKSNSLVEAVAEIKNYISSIDIPDLEKVTDYLMEKNPDNFPLERCLTLVGIKND